MIKKIKKAFTLIELLVVIVIIGILASISVSTFGNYIDRGHQAKSQALQGQINTLIGIDCLKNNYSCGLNLVPNWAFSAGNTGEWALGNYYEITNYKLSHENRINGSIAVDYITLPLSKAMTSGKIYRVDAISRKVNTGTVALSNPFGFSSSGGVSGYETQNNKHICDVFKYTSGSVRLFSRAGVEIEFDEVSLREVDDYSDVTNNNDCGLDIEIQS